MVKNNQKLFKKPKFSTVIITTKLQWVYKMTVAMWNFHSETAHKCTSSDNKLGRSRISTEQHPQKHLRFDDSLMHSRITHGIYCIAHQNNIATTFFKNSFDISIENVHK